ncbi:hypothetical protein [uncultured Nostoc sp.]|uniref:hypothetical protein n=1 Tax=uncultured Nostoc sp. TaxID=340711 RepID=UPI0035CA3F1C
MSINKSHDYFINFGIAVENLSYTIALLVGDAYGGKLRCYYGIQQHTQPLSIRFDDHGLVWFLLGVNVDKGVFFS